MNQHQRVSQILGQLELELKRLDLWQESAPAAEALASTLPFCVDTLEFHQWLQFVLLLRLRQILLLQMPLPTQIALYPMATEVYKQSRPHHEQLIACLAELDEALTGRPVERTL